MPIALLGLVSRIDPAPAVAVSAVAITDPFGSVMPPAALNTTVPAFSTPAEPAETPMAIPPLPVDRVSVSPLPTPRLPVTVKGWLSPRLRFPPLVRPAELPIAFRLLPSAIAAADPDRVLAVRTRPAVSLIVPSA